MFVLSPREQGNLGEYSAVEWFMSKGMGVAVPIGHTPDWDLIAEIDGHVARVQVKTAGRYDKGRWAVSLATRGGNRSWSGLVKYLDPTRCDYLFVLVGDGRRWLIPAGRLECSSQLTLGGPKYAEFEVEPGVPFVHQRCRRTALQSAA